MAEVDQATREATRNRENSNVVEPRPPRPSLETRRSNIVPNGTRNVTIRATPSSERPHFHCPSPGKRSDHRAAVFGSIWGRPSGSWNSRANGVPHATQRFMAIGFALPHTGHGHVGSPSERRGGASTFACETARGASRDA